MQFCFYKGGKRLLSISSPLLASSGRTTAVTVLNSHPTSQEVPSDSLGGDDGPRNIVEGTEERRRTTSYREQHKVKLSSENAGSIWKDTTQPDSCSWGTE